MKGLGWEVEVWGLWKIMEPPTPAVVYVVLSLCVKVGLNSAVS